MESSLSAERSLKEELTLARDELAAQLKGAKESLTAERDKLLAELDEAIKHLETLQQNCVCLEQSLANEKNEKAVIINEKEAMSCQLVDLGLTLEAMKEDMKVKEENITCLQVREEEGGMVGGKEGGRERRTGERYRNVRGRRALAFSYMYQISSLGICEAWMGVLG